MQCLLILCSSVIFGFPNKMVSDLLYFHLIFRGDKVYFETNFTKYLRFLNKTKMPLMQPN